jgi:Flp pilus assembly protein TadD
MSRAGIKTIAATALLIFLSAAVSSWAFARKEEVCDVAADSALGVEDYATAVTLHRKLLGSHPNDALAHYHLGFAYGMLGRDADEISEYLAAVNLGFQKWDLFLNLGQAYLERHELAHATAALQTAASLGPEHAETHFNLALVYARRNRLPEALREITASRRLAPEDLDAGNTNAIICAEMDDLSCAQDTWTDLIQRAPDYAPARRNIVILRRRTTLIVQSKQHQELPDSQPEVTAGHVVGGQFFEDLLTKTSR